MDRKFLLVTTIFLVAFVSAIGYFGYATLLSGSVNAAQLTASPDRSLILAYPLSLAADGTSESKVDVFVSTDDGTPIPGRRVRLSLPLGISEPPEAVTDSNGQATFAVTSLDPGVSEIGYTVEADTYPQTIAVTFE